MTIMAEIAFILKESIRVPLDLSTISPDVIAGKSLQEILSLEAWRGNRRVNLGEIFRAAGDSGAKPEDTAIILQGDLSKARRIGKGMSSGRIVVSGAGGLYVGEGMKGGVIEVRGNAGPWVGVGMKGGVIEVQGDAGDYLGSGYRGKNEGMKGGTITVAGCVANAAGLWMKGGTIRVKGKAGLLAGAHMQGGNMVVEGDSEGRVGAEMTDGKIVLLGMVPSILPGFSIEEVRSSTKIGDEKLSGPFYTFAGDLTELGKGKLFVSADKNPHLKNHLNYMV